MKHPNKWRETVDIFSLSFTKIEVLEIIGYPHAGNDVFHVKVLYNNVDEVLSIDEVPSVDEVLSIDEVPSVDEVLSIDEVPSIDEVYPVEMNAFVKVERQHNADIENEVHILSALSFPFVPKILEYSLSEPRFIVTKEVHGERLSVICKNNPGVDIKPYLKKQAATLSEYHRLQIHCNPVKSRKFFYIPKQEHFTKYKLENVQAFLKSNVPQESTNCFVHGDFHYANILWEDEKISCVLDYELSGLGIREFDMAWAIFLRPGQAFSDTWDDVESFLEGYKNHYSLAGFCYYYVLIAVHFYPLDDEIYQQKIRRLIQNAISVYQSKTTLS